MLKRIILTLFLCFPLYTYADPSFTIEDDQKFQKNQGLGELRSFIITDTNGEITKDFGLNISLPDDYPSIFYVPSSKNNVVIYGTAVDNGRVDPSQELQFINKGKTLHVSVKEDFEPGETLLLSRLWLKDIYSSSDSRYPYIEFAEGKKVVSPKYLSADTSSNSNSQIPDIPYNQKVEIIEGNKVKVSWEDSYDLDLTQILLLRGKNSAASGTVFQYIEAGKQEFIDEDLKIGDKMEYYVIATDGRNRSLFPTLLSITVSEYVAPVVEEVVLEDSQDSEQVLDSENNLDLSESSDEETIGNKRKYLKIPSNADMEVMKNRVYTRSDIKEIAVSVSEIRSPRERLKSTRMTLKRFPNVKDRVWFMRYLIREIMRK